MRRWLVSELDERAAAVAQAQGWGLETTAFCAPENMDNAELIARKARELARFPACALHAPYFELTPCAIDPLARRMCKTRILQAAATCFKLGIADMVVHSGALPRVYYPEWFVPRSIEFWREVMPLVPVGLRLHLENVLDPRAEELAAIADGVAHERFGLCLDIGHARVYSAASPERWIDALGGRITHVHLHNNDGASDLHAALDDGVIDMDAVLARLDACAPRADFTLESTDAGRCVDWLEKRGYLT